METVKILIEQTAVMLVLILFGAFLYKKGVFTKKGGKQLSNFVISAVCPVLIFTSFQKELDQKLVNGLLLSFLLALISHIVLITFSTLIFNKKWRGEDYAVEQFAATYSNCAFLGIPLVGAVYGSEGIFYVTAYIALFNLLSWTHGVMLMTGNISAKSLLNVLKAPAVIATIAGVVFFFAGIILPEVVLEPLEYISSLNTPLAMIVSGIMISQSNLKKALKKGGLYLTCAVKLIIIPIIIILIFIPFSENTTVINTAIIAASAPTAASTIMLATKHKKNGVYAAEIFAVSTIASVVTMPLMIVIANFVYSLV